MANHKERNSYFIKNIQLDERRQKCKHISVLIKETVNKKWEVNIAKGETICENWYFRKSLFLVLLIYLSYEDEGGFMLH